MPSPLCCFEIRLGGKSYCIDMPYVFDSSHNRERRFRISDSHRRHIGGNALSADALTSDSRFAVWLVWLGWRGPIGIPELVRRAESPHQCAFPECAGAMGRRAASVRPRQRDARAKRLQSLYSRGDGAHATPSAKSHKSSF